jgi:hypothetical protein
MDGYGVYQEFGPLCFWSLFLFDSRENRLSPPGASVPLCLELPPMLNADTPVRIRVNSVGTPPMLIGEIA